MRHRRQVCGAFLVALVALAAGEAQAGRWWGRGPVVAPACGVGGFGYSYSWSRSGWWGGWRFGWGGRGVRPAWSGWCDPGMQWSGPCWHGGWYGGTTWRAVDAVCLSVPAGGGVTFFSGRMVPVPVWGWGWGHPTQWQTGWQLCPGVGVWTPYAVPLPAGVGPQWGPAGVLPFMGLSAAAGGRPAVGQGIVRGNARGAPGQPVVAAAPRIGGRAVAMRASTAMARARAARLVAVGDRHLRAAGRDPAEIGRAADAYRRAAAVAADQPDIHVRHAVALVALGRDDQANDALARAVAIDGRLAPPAAPAADEHPNPVFGDRVAGEPAPLAARGAAILREIGEGAADGEPGPARLAELWARRWQAPGAAVATIR